MGKIAKGVDKINFTMLYSNYCYIIVENFPQKLSLCTITLSVANRGVSRIYPWFQVSALHLVVSAGCSLFWVAQAERNHHGRSLSTTIDAFEPKIEGKTAAIRAETQQSDFAVSQRSTTRFKTSENLYILFINFYIYIKNCVRYLGLECHYTVLQYSSV